MKKEVLVMAFLVFAITLVASIAWTETKKEGGLVIGVPMEFINPELFEPDTAVFKVVGVGDSTVTLYYQLMEITNGTTHSGKTVRTGTAVIPKAPLIALQSDMFGNIGDTAALSALLASFNIRKRQ